MAAVTQKNRLFQVLHDHPLFEPKAFHEVFADSSLFQWKEIDKVQGTKWAEAFTEWALDQIADSKRDDSEFLKRFYQLHDVKNLTPTQKKELAERAIYCGEMVFRLPGEYREDAEEDFRRKNLESINQQATQALAGLILDDRHGYNTLNQYYGRLHYPQGLPWRHQLDALPLAWQGLLCGPESLLITVLEKKYGYQMPNELMPLLVKQIHWKQCSPTELIRGFSIIAEIPNLDLPPAALEEGLRRISTIDEIPNLNLPPPAALEERRKRENLRLHMALCGRGMILLKPPENSNREIPLLWVNSAVECGHLGNVQALLEAGVRAGLPNFLQEGEYQTDLFDAFRYTIRRALEKRRIDIAYALAKVPCLNPLNLMHLAALRPIFIHAVQKNDTIFIETLIEQGVVRQSISKAELREAIAQARSAGHEALAARLTECLTQKRDGVDPANRTALARVRRLSSFIARDEREKAANLLSFLLLPENGLHQTFFLDPNLKDELSRAFERATAKDWFFLVDPLLAWGIQNPQFLRPDLWSDETMNKIFCRLAEQQKLDELRAFLDEAENAATDYNVKRVFEGNPELPPFAKLLTDGFHLPAFRKVMKDTFGADYWPMHLFPIAFQNIIANGSLDSLREFFGILQESEYTPANLSNRKKDLQVFQTGLSTAVEQNQLPMACESARLFFKIGCGEKIPPADAVKIYEYASQTEGFNDVAENLAPRRADLFLAEEPEEQPRKKPRTGEI